MRQQTTTTEADHTLTNLNQNKKLTALVTGGSGLVGSHVINQLLKEGVQVKALYRIDIPAIQGAGKVTWFKGDILDVTAVEEAMQNISHVYHCAAIVSFNPKRKQELFKTNVEGTANVVNAALNSGIKKLCYVSSVAALGVTKNGSEINERVTWSEEDNKSNYSKSKYLAEVEVWRGIGEGLKAVIVNPSIILGAGNWNEGSTKLFKTAYEEFAWYTTGITGFVDVADVVDVMIQLMKSDVSGEKFILSAENKQYKEVFTLMANAFGRKAPHKKVSNLLADIIWRAEAIKSIFGDKEPLLTKETASAAQSIRNFNNSKIKNYLPSFSFTPLEETIRRIAVELKEKNKLSL